MKLAATALALIVAANTFAVTRARYLMGTVCEVSAADGRQIDAAFAEAARVEAMISTWRNDSELARVNAGAPAGEELSSLLRVVDVWRDKSGGAFNPHIRGLIDVWKTREGGAVPSAADIAKALGRKEIEEGAFGKGYALDRMLAKIDGDAILNFGGQLLVRGSYDVTIADPEHRDSPLYKLTLTNASLSTSSGSEKTFIVDGHVFTHIFDPRTGEALPPRGSVSVIASSALLADIQSTALYVMGVDDGLRWADANGVAALFI
ncbi:MAG TPA: FAD:protein FMN transferase, partial [Thermoanaerobaculia bacterium]|nr:FAD:protein FMN transferase [Thermoanaerobaculia bacterium]